MGIKHHDGYLTAEKTDRWFTKGQKYPYSLTTNTAEITAFAGDSEFTIRTDDPAFTIHPAEKVDGCFMRASETGPLFTEGVDYKCTLRPGAEGLSLGTDDGDLHFARCAGYSPSLCAGMEPAEAEKTVSVAESMDGLMTVRDFLVKHAGSSALYDTYSARHPVFEPGETAALSAVQIYTAIQESRCRFEKFIKTVTNHATGHGDMVMFAAPQVPLSPREYGTLPPHAHIRTWLCDRRQILDHVSPDMVQWRPDCRIQSLPYATMPWEDILSAGLWIHDLSGHEMDVACEIINIMTTFGWDESEHAERTGAMSETFRQVFAELEGDSPEKIPAEQLFRRMWDDAYNNASDGEKERMSAEMEKRKEREGRDRQFTLFALEMNYRTCANAVAGYCLSVLSSGAGQ